MSFNGQGWILRDSTGGGLSVPIANQLQFNDIGPPPQQITVEQMPVLLES